ncbi:hypothetical protein [Paenibacillus polymyxa]|uniref:hypothetical protein n=1 Tax=Paenibacillus polymyxa TaxID=1406 RepID=UPI001688F772|nr:hypothetical protein [Paenibacillus polymyxa]
MTTVSIIHGKPYSRETATVFLRSTDNRCDKQRLSALNPVVSRTAFMRFTILMKKKRASMLESGCFFCREDIIVRQTPTVFRLSSVQIASLGIGMDDIERVM